VLNKKNIARFLNFPHAFRKARPILAHLISSSGAPPGWQEPEFQDEKLSRRPEAWRLLTLSGRYPAVEAEETRNQGAVGVVVLRRNCSLGVKRIGKKTKEVPGEGGKHLEVLSWSTLWCDPW